MLSLLKWILFCRQSREQKVDLNKVVSPEMRNVLKPKNNIIDANNIMTIPKIILNLH